MIPDQDTHLMIAYLTMLLLPMALLLIDGIGALLNSRNGGK
jgi:hypothetical protein